VSTVASLLKYAVTLSVLNPGPVDMKHAKRLFLFVFFVVLRNVLCLVLSLYFFVTVYLYDIIVLQFLTFLLISTI